MKLYVKSISWVALTVCSAAIMLGRAQGQFPEGPGRPILERACGSCHGAEAITNYHFTTADEYKDIVNSMIGSGAQVSPTELPVLVDYIFVNWGKKPEGAPAAPANVAAADPGKAILESACTVCHGLDGMANHKYDSKDPYMALVSNMIGYGANVTDAQIGPLVDYMFKTYGVQPAVAAAPAATAEVAGGVDPGKAILDSACTVCHGLDGLANHKYDAKEPYVGLVQSMVAYGASVTDAQMGPLVDYLFKTYGAK